MTEVKSTFPAGGNLKVHGLNERSVIQGWILRPISTGAIVPPAVWLNFHCEPHFLQAQQSHCADGPETCPCWLNSRLNGKSSGKFDCRNFQPVTTSVPLCLGTAARLRQQKSFQFPKKLQKPGTFTCWCCCSHSLSQMHWMGALDHAQLVNQQGSISLLIPCLQMSKALLSSSYYTIIIYNPNA